MKVNKFIYILFFTFIMFSCSNSHEINDDYEVDLVHYVVPNISPYDDDTEIVEYCIPKNAGTVDLPQYADWDTIFFGYSARYRWDNSNLDSIRLLSLDTNHPWNWNGFFILKKD